MISLSFKHFRWNKIYVKIHWRHFFFQYGKLFSPECIWLRICQIPFILPPMFSSIRSAIMLFIFFLMNTFAREIVGISLFLHFSFSTTPYNYMYYLLLRYLWTLTTTDLWMFIHLELRYLFASFLTKSRFCMERSYIHLFWFAMQRGPRLDKFWNNSKLWNFG